MTKHYTPELGQAVFGNPTGEYDCPRFVDALVAGLLSEIARVFWNTRGRSWDEFEDPKIPGVEFRPYYWGDDEAEAAKPNLAHAGIEVRWYKHPGRGSSLNIPPDPVRMAGWFASALAVIQAEDASDDDLTYRHARREALGE